MEAQRVPARLEAIEMNAAGLELAIQAAQAPGRIQSLCAEIGADFHSCIPQLLRHLARLFKPMRKVIPQIPLGSLSKEALKLIVQRFVAAHRLPSETSVETWCERAAARFGVFQPLHAHGHLLKLLKCETEGDSAPDAIRASDRAVVLTYLSGGFEIDARVARREAVEKTCQFITVLLDLLHTILAAPPEPCARPTPGPIPVIDLVSDEEDDMPAPSPAQQEEQEEEQLDQGSEAAQLGSRAGSRNGSEAGDTDAREGDVPMAAGPAVPNQAAEEVTMDGLPPPSVPAPSSAPAPTSPPFPNGVGPVTPATPVTTSAPRRRGRPRLSSVVPRKTPRQAVEEVDGSPPSSAPAPSSAAAPTSPPFPNGVAPVTPATSTGRRRGRPRRIQAADEVDGSPPPSAPAPTSPPLPNGVLPVTPTTSTRRRRGRPSRSSVTRVQTPRQAPDTPSSRTRSRMAM